MVENFAIFYEWVAIHPTIDHQNFILILYFEAIMSLILANV